MGGLIDTTEMYLKIVYEMIEDGVAPLRARIVDRLGHSGPTVSQTVSRMERDGLLYVGRDRRINLTDDGRKLAIKVMRKHRLSEQLLLSQVGLGWVKVHEEACRWEHVMSDEVADKLQEMLHHPSTDPYGNPIPEPGCPLEAPGISVTRAVDSFGSVVDAKVVRIGEPIQGAPRMLAAFDEVGVKPGNRINLEPNGEGIVITGVESAKSVFLPAVLAMHLFIEPLKK